MREVCACMCCIVHAPRCSGACGGQRKVFSDAVSWSRGAEAVLVVCSLQSIYSEMTLKRTRRGASCMAHDLGADQMAAAAVLPPYPMCQGRCSVPRLAVVDLLETAEVFLAHRHSLTKEVLLSQQSSVTTGRQRHRDQNAST